MTQSEYLKAVISRLKVEWRILKPYLKVVAFCCFMLLYMSTVVFRNLAYYNFTPGPPLHDLGFKLIPELNDFWTDFSEYILLFTHFLGMGLLFFLPILTETPHKNRMSTVSIGLRVMIILTFGHCLRFITYIGTTLPGQAEHCLADSPLFNPPSSIFEVFFRFGTYNSKKCGDLVFSGHMFQDLTLAMGVWEYGTRLMKNRNLVRVLQASMFALCIIQAILIVGSRNHYTIDIVIAAYVAPTCWLGFDRVFYDIAYPVSDESELKHSVVELMGTPRVKQSSHRLGSIDDIIPAINSRFTSLDEEKPVEP